MKKSVIRLISLIVTVLAFSLYSSILFSQERNLKSEILVFFMPDSLELPAQAKNRVALTDATIRSKQLSGALQKTKPTGIEKAFPDWQKGSKVSVENEEVEAPPFGRIFILTFNTEAEADAAINILSKINGVVFAEKHSQITSYNDEHYINGNQWYLNNNGANGGVVGADINAEGAWAIYTGNPNITIAIIDNGVEITHEDLAGKASGDTPVGYSHGTSVAGVAAARANNTHGIRGVDWNAQILSKRVRDSYDGWLGDNVAAQKIADAVNEGADVLNCSWGGPTYSTTLAVAFAFAYRANRVTVAASGNEGIQLVNYPAGYSNVMAVGATQNDDNISPFSTTGTHIDVVAPGGIHPAGFTNEEDIITTTTNNNYEYVSGTSFAAPQVAGLASLLEGYNSNLDNDDIRQIIRLSADDRGDPGFDNEYGFGRLNAGRALEFLQAPYALRQWTATSGSVENTVGLYAVQFLGAPGLASANYFVKRHEVRKTITFPESFLHIEGVWGRGVFTSGWRHANPNFGEGFCEIVPGTLTETGVTLRTYVYEIYTISLQYVGYYPATPANVTFAYTVLGIPLPTLSGPSTVCTSGATFTLSYLPPVDSIIWSTGPNLTVYSGQNTNSPEIKATGSGSSWVNARLVTTCGSITLSEKDVWAGVPGVPVTFQVSPLYENINTIFSVHIYDSPGADPASTVWETYGCVSLHGPGSGSNASFYSCPNDGCGVIYVTTSNVCGSSNNTALTVITGSGGDCDELPEFTDPVVFVISPNPATSETTVTIESTSEEKTFDETARWDLEIFSETQILKTKQTGLRGRNAKIQTAGWQEGVYLVRVNYKGEILTGKLLVKK